MSDPMTHVDHIGIAVKDLERSIALFERLLGVPCYAVEEVAEQQVRTAFFKLGQTKIELLQSTQADGPIGTFIEKRGEGIHHIAFAVDDLEAALRDAESAGLRIIEATPRNGAEGSRIAFLHPKSTGGVLIELCAAPRTND
jgi:methylmalonyl-CoA/ethylmalonyl-CoA epimerase